MVEIGGKPILWHIMKMYAARGIDEFIVCLGYYTSPSPSPAWPTRAR